MKQEYRNQIDSGNNDFQANQCNCTEGEIALLFNTIKKELKTDKAYEEFFKQYNADSVDAFIENYASKKARYITYGEMLNKNSEQASIRRQDEAEERLWEIQRKKLFDLECQWRAESLKIPQIEITTDFEFWEKNIASCPFLSQITEDEFELYVDYIASDDFFDFKMEYMWMNYNDIKGRYKEHGSIPPWYEYYDLRKGTGSFLILPDIRGDKEEYYLNIWRSHKAAEFDSKIKPVKKDTRPFLKSYDIKVIEDFIKKFENLRMHEYFKMYEDELYKSNDEVERAFITLKEADEEISLPFNTDWRSSLIQAARNYEKRKLIEALRNAYSKYKYRLEVGISPETLDQEDNIEWIKEWSDEVKNKIVNARVLNNETADLNF
jgi:hypothetical protein